MTQEKEDNDDSANHSRQDRKTSLVHQGVKQKEEEFPLQLGLYWWECFTPLISSFTVLASMDQCSGVKSGLSLKVLLHGEQFKKKMIEDLKLN